MSSISSNSSFTLPLSKTSTCIYCDSVITFNEHTFKDCVKELSINLRRVYSDEKLIDDVEIATRIRLLKDAINKRATISDELNYLIDLYNLFDNEEEEKEECKHQPNENNNTLFDVEMGYLRMLDDALKAELDLNYELAITNYSEATSLMLVTHKMLKSDELKRDLTKKVDYYLQKAEELKKKRKKITGSDDTKSTDFIAL